MRADIHVQIDPGLPALDQRLSVSHGAEIMSGASTGKWPYLPGAVVPHDSWSLPAHQALQRLSLSQQKPLPPHRTIRVTRMGKAWDELRESLAVLPYQSMEEYCAYARSEKILNKLGPALMQLDDLLRDSHDFQVAGLKVNPCGMRSTTLRIDSREPINGSDAAVAGLHVDNMDSRNLETRPQARQRLSINLGSRERYFVFVAESLQSLQQRLDLSEECLVYHKLSQTLLEQEPETAIYRLAIQPGEAYIAPTENILHDGAAPDGKGFDLSLVLLGHFHVERSLHV